MSNNIINHWLAKNGNPEIEKQVQLEAEQLISNFSVNTYSLINENSPTYAHWSEGLKMIIIKDGVTMRLNSEEIEQLVKALPRTVGGIY
jgi:hypothetical protein